MPTSDWKGCDTVNAGAGGLSILIDRNLCVGFGDCIEVAPRAFKLDEEGVAVLLEPEAAGRDRLLRACAACPVDAITVLNASGEVLIR